MFLTLLGGLTWTETTGVSDVRGTAHRLFSPEGTPPIPDSNVASREPDTDTKTNTQVVRVGQEGKDTKQTKTPAPKQPAPEPYQPWTPTPKQQDWLAAVAKEPLQRQIESINRKMLEVNKSVVRMTLEPKEGPPTKCTITQGYPYLIWPLFALPSLTALDLTAAGVTDFTPLARMPLTELNVNLIVDNVKSEAALKSMATLKTINGRPAAEYWAERAALRKEIDDRAVNASALSLNARQAWFNSMMKKLNPKWSGKSGGGLAKDKTNGLITLSFILTAADAPVFDFSPVRALGVEAVSLNNTPHLCDLSPLAKSKLQIFRYVNASGGLRDLSPLAGMPLKELDLTGAWSLTDISPLAGMKLESLQLWHFAKVADVKVLYDMPITTLALPHLITDLRPFESMKLTTLGSSATDLAPLAGMPLETLTFRGSRPADLSPLANMKLKHYTCSDFNGGWWWFRTDYERDETMFRAMPLATINQIPAAKFWAAFDADRKVLQEFVTATAKLAPAEAVAAVKEALKKKGRAVADSRIEDGAVVEVKLLPVQGSKFDPNPLGPLKAFRRLKKITFADISPIYWPDLAPLMKLPIEEIVCAPAAVAGNTIILRQMPTLKTINGKPADEVLRIGQEAPPGEKDDKTVAGVQTLDPDRRAAEYVLSHGGAVKVNGQNKEVRASADLPADSFHLTGIRLWNADGYRVTVTDAGLAVFKDCKNLTEISTYRTKLGDAGLTHFQCCKGLTALGLIGSSVTDAGLAAFKDCKSLTNLNLTSTSITDAGLAHFNGCKDLKDLILNGNAVGDAGLAHFRSCKGLLTIGLSNTQVTDAGLAHFNGCGELTGLNLSKTQVSGAGLVHFKSCKNLKNLQLHGTQVIDAELARVKDWKNLASLRLQDTQVSDAGLAHLAGLDKLTALYLTKTQVTAKGVEELAKTLPRCKIEWDGGTIKPAESRP